MGWWDEAELVIYAMPVYFVLISAELIISNWKGQPIYSWRGTLTNGYLVALSILLDLATRAMSFAVLLFFYRRHFTVIADPVLYWISLLLLQDLALYCMHLFDHKCRAFWAVHVTHHSSEEFNLTIGFRSSLFQPLYRFAWFVPLALIGFRPLDIFLMYSITQIYGVLIHTQHVRKLGPLEWILATPSHHRVHHGSNPQYLDKNMGMVFIVWDRLFGTFEPEVEPVVYGLTCNINSHHPATVIFHEWSDIWSDIRSAPTYRDKLWYLFGPPGWSHDGSKEAMSAARSNRNPLQFGQQLRKSGCNNSAEGEIPNTTFPRIEKI